MKDEEMAEELKATDTMRNAIAFCREKEIIIPIANLLIEFVEQEIAEIKKDKENLIDENNFYKALVPVLEDNAEQLRNDLKQAKEIIKEVVNSHNYFDILEAQKKAEQFLRDIQKANEGLNLDKIVDEVEQDTKEQKVK